MNRKDRKFLIIAAILVSLVAINVKFSKVNVGIEVTGADVNIKNPMPIAGKMTYDVRLGRVSLGEAVLSHKASEEVNGKLLNVVIFETNIVRFKDTEKIYSDPETLLPVKIERQILNWFNNEKITEDYDQEKFTLTVTKQHGPGQDKTVIKKDAPIHNAILLPYCIRNMPRLNLGYVLSANLPNNQFEVNLVSVEEIEVPAGIFNAYHFETLPKQIGIWISADEHRIPVKIQGAGPFGYLMVLKERN